MTAELLILRHGKSSWKDADLHDYDRPLKQRGARAARRMGRYMLDHDLLPAVVYSSTAQRARDTALLACEAMGLAQDHIHWDRDLYHAPVQAHLSRLRTTAPGVQRAMLVGHNPGLEELLLYLCGQNLPVPEDGKLLPTAALAHVLLPDGWSVPGPGCGRLQSIVRPRALTP